MDNSRHRAESDHLLADLESIRELLGEEHADDAAQVVGEAQIPLLFDVVGERRVPSDALDEPEDDAGLEIPTLQPEASPDAAPLTFIAAEPDPVPEPLPPQAMQDPSEQRARLEAELRDAAPGILHTVVAEFAPHIEAEVKRRLEARLEALVKDSARKG